MPSELPIERVVELRREGLSRQQIVNELKKQGLSEPQINEAITQADIKENIVKKSTENREEFNEEMQPSILSKEDSEIPEPGPPSVSTYRESQEEFQAPQTSFLPPAERTSEERIEEITEAIIEEKWKDLISKIGDISIWKERVKVEISSIKQEVIRVENRFENLQNAVLKRVDEYDRSIKIVGSEMKALEKVLEKILQPLTENIKELQKITQKLKK